MRKFLDMKVDVRCLPSCEIDAQIGVYCGNQKPMLGLFKGIIDGEIPQLLLQRSDDYKWNPGLVSIPLGDICNWCRVYPIKPIDAAVYPSEAQTISVAQDPVYGGAHYYIIRDCDGFINGRTVYNMAEQIIRFVHKNDDGTVIPGLQSEQLVLALLDRHEKLNARFPSEQNAKMIAGLRMFLEACEERVKERMERGVMGELKK